MFFFLKAENLFICYIKIKSRIFIMMKTAKFFKIISLFMAMMIFVSSLGYSLDIHYCGGEFFEFSFVGDITECKGKDHFDVDKEKFTKKGCCDLDHFQVETSNQFQLSSFDIDQSTLNLKTFSFFYHQLIFEENINRFSPKTLDYPPIVCTNKVYREIECFLI